MKKSSNLLTELELLYADDCFLAVHKAPGIPCQSKNRLPPFPLEHSLKEYINEPVRLWTRIDQPVSGIVLFYRSSLSVQAQKPTIVKKCYLGFVEGHPERDQRILVSRIQRNGRINKSFENTKGKRAELSYSVLKGFENYSLLKIIPVTGRFHQIRQQMSEIGHPIKGDVKYGARRKNPDRSIHLHALEYKIRHRNEKRVTIYDYSLPDDPLWNLARKSILDKGLG